MIAVRPLQIGTLVVITLLLTLPARTTAEGFDKDNFNPRKVDGKKDNDKGKDNPKKDNDKGKDNPKKENDKGKDNPKKDNDKGKDNPKKDNDKGKDNPKKDNDKGKDNPKKDDDKGKKDDIVFGKLHEVELSIGGAERRALVRVPKSAASAAAPVVFVFHGHGQNMNVAARDFRIHEHWDDAICVYMQGLKTATGGDPKGQELGWQNAPATEGGRDLHFFDAMLARLSRQCQVDRNRVYAAGFSNGANFTYVLWATRANVLRAVAACAGANQYIKNATPRPCLHIGGEKDTVVDYDNQQRTMELVRKVNGCEAKGSPWMKSGSLRCTLYESSRGAPFVSAIHNGGHEVPNEAGKLAVRFFQQFGN